MIEEENIDPNVSETERPETEGIQSGDRAQSQFGYGSLRSHTNQSGTSGREFNLIPSVAAVSSAFPYSEALVRAKHPVQDFWVYDGAHPGLADRGKISTSLDQVLPNKRVKEQDAVEWNRVGSKKGWMFNGTPQQEKPGGTGENMPTHTSDGFINRVRDNKWFPMERSSEKQGLATRELPAIDINNNARGIGVTGEGSGNGGMAGGYRAVNAERLARLPIPMARFNHTGTRLAGTGREDQGLGSGAGGRRSGYASSYPIRPSFPLKRTIGISKVTQNAA